MIEAKMLLYEELPAETGKEYDELWNLGFELEDYDFILKTNKPLRPCDQSNYWSEELENEQDYDELASLPEECFEPEEEAYWLEFSMRNHCIGYQHILLDGSHYYIVHHA